MTSEGPFERNSFSVATERSAAIAAAHAARAAGTVLGCRRRSPSRASTASDPNKTKHGDAQSPMDVCRTQGDGWNQTQGRHSGPARRPPWGRGRMGGDARRELRVRFRRKHRLEGFVGALSASGEHPAPADFDTVRDKK